MSTEYRRGIPSTAHIEAATRLGLLWHRQSSNDTYVRFAVVGEQVLSRISTKLGLIEEPVVNVWPYEGDFSYHPIRPDGTLVDWEVLDQEVARAGQQGQPQGFRADLWRRIRAHLANGSGCGLPDVSALDSMGFSVQSPFFEAEVLWPQGTNPANILARWTVYQELKPLYDLVDGAEGEAAMPEDVTEAWHRESGAYNAGAGWLLRRRNGNLEAVSSNSVVASRVGIGSTWASRSSAFAVLDAAAERRVAERMRGQTQAPTVTSAQPEPRRFADVRQQLAAERAAQPTEEMPITTSRFDLIEPDPQADPTASIRAWEARQAAAKVRPVAVPPRTAKPAAAPRRPVIEVVDVEVDGLSRVEVVTALFGRAFNGGC